MVFENKISQIQSNLNFWWAVSICILIFSCVFLGICVFTYNTYYSSTVKEVNNDNDILHNIIVS